MILVTGSSGFVGSAVVKKLVADGFAVRQITRDPSIEVSESLVYVPSINSLTDWSNILNGVTTVIHCAALAHQMNENDRVPDDYWKVNVDGTVKLAQDSIRCGVSRLVFVSSIKVCGEYTHNGFAFSPDSPRAPADIYAKTKAIAEEQLFHLSQKSNLQIVVIRPPLVYGPGAKGNLALLRKLVSLGMPIPLGSIKNKRSLIGVENLADLLSVVANHPAASGRIFHASDRQSLSISETLTILGIAMKKKVIILRVPEKILKLGARLLRKTDVFDRLSMSLEVDSTSCYELLGWKPVYSTEESVSSLVEYKN